MRKSLHIFLCLFLLSVFLFLSWSLSMFLRFFFSFSFVFCIPHFFHCCSFLLFSEMQIKVIIESKKDKK